jgi:hypothetical protein
MVVPEKTKSCGNCGFLCVKRRTTVGQHEFEPPWRKLGWLSDSDTLLCFRNVAQLHEEVDRIEQTIRESSSFQKTFEDDTPRFAAVRQVEEGHTDCPKWYEYVQYFGPQWHYEKMHIESLEEANRANATKIAELDLRTQESIREIQRESQGVAKEHKDLFKRSDEQTRRLQIWFLVLAVLTVLLALVPAVSATI